MRLGCGLNQDERQWKSPFHWKIILLLFRRPKFGDLSKSKNNWNLNSPNCCGNTVPLHQRTYYHSGCSTARPLATRAPPAIFHLLSTINTLSIAVEQKHSDCHKSLVGRNIEIPILISNKQENNISRDFIWTLRTWKIPLDLPTWSIGTLIRSLKLWFTSNIIYIQK